MNDIPPVASIYSKNIYMQTCTVQLFGFDIFETVYHTKLNLKLAYNLMCRNHPINFQHTSLTNNLSTSMT